MKCHTLTLINRISMFTKLFSANKQQKTTSNLLKILFYVSVFSIVSATVSQARDVTLRWDPSTDTSITGYKIYYSADSASKPLSGTGSAQGASPINVNKLTSSTLSGLDAGRSYYFAVTAYNASGTESLYSNTVNVAEATPPAVSISSPATNTTISGTVSVTASATDNVGVTKVEYYLNGVLKTSETSTPYLYSLSTASLAPGIYTLMAKAYDAAGNVGQSSNVSVTVINDTTAPTVSLTVPANNANGTIVITANASDNVGVNKVEFYRNGEFLTATNVSPYRYSWDTTTAANGSYTLAAKAYDNAGNVAQSVNVLVTVNNLVSDTEVPTIRAFKIPVTSTTLRVPITAFTASDNIGVAAYCVTSTNSIANCDWLSFPNTSFAFSSLGTKTAYAWVKDAAGNVSASKNAIVSIALADTTAPTVSITTPTNNVTLSGTVSVAATASDNLAVSKVEFYINGALQATDTATPYSFSWNTASVVNGAYSLTVKAYDAAGNSSTSSTVILAVSNSAATYTFWPSATVPVSVDAGADSPVELGVKFRTDVKGSITGLRLYKASTNTGSHVANLWTNTGTLLATANFTNETASGWQQVNFSTPVAITANTVYVASYHGNVGHYSDDQKYFAGKGVDNGPLHALADGVSGYSGVYAYSSASKFPNQSWNSSNYWVDVVFKP